MARIEAAREILDRTFGKPTVTIVRDAGDHDPAWDESDIDSFERTATGVPSRTH